MDRNNGGDPLAPPRPPKPIPGVHRPRAPEPPIMSASLSPTHHQNQQQQQQRQQQAHLRTNNHQHHQNYQSNTNNNGSNTSNLNNNISRISNNSSLISNSNSISSSNSTNNNNNHSSSAVLPVHPVPITAPLIPLHQQQQTHNISNNSLSSTTISSTNSFTRPRPLPPLVVNHNSNTLLPSVSSNLVHGAESPVSPVTLAAPRPESERLRNEYVDTPLRSHHHLATRAQHPAGHATGQVTTQHALLLLQHNERRQQQLQHSHPSHNQHNSNAISSANISLSNVGGSGGGTNVSGGGAPTLSRSNTSSSHKGSSGTTTSLGSTQTTTSTTLLLSGQTARQQPPPGTRPNALPIAAITKQPVSFSKDSMPASGLHEDSELHHSAVTFGECSPNSIQCPRCNKCRCDYCKNPKLPSRWLCDKSCLCSAEAVIDYASCLCCVKALFYHCAKDREMECDEGDIISCADDPCSCLPHKRATRWGWLGALSVVLPCLWCYWPMRGCAALCAKCYVQIYRNDCRCQTSILAPIPATNAVSAAKTADGGRARPAGVTTHHLNAGSGVPGSGHHGCGNGRTVSRTNDLTPEKRLLDSSPEY